MTEVRKGRVIRADAKVFHVDFGDEVCTCAPRGKLFDELDDNVKSPVAVGDWVHVSLDGDPAGIEEVLPRTNYLSRTASSHDPREQILFSNVDQLFVISSLEKPRFSSNRTDRILAACRYHEIPASLVINKIDLDKRDDLDDICETYEAAGIDVLPTCAADGRGIQPLAELLRDKVSVFYGASGAGKSTLLNLLEPTLDLKTAKISKYWDSGRHTTTFSQIHTLHEVGGLVVDTPGIRAFRLYDINKAELRDLFPEFEPYRGKCEFSDCSHDHEPGCVVYEAVEALTLSPTRYGSYIEILDELAPPPDDNTPVAPPGA